MVKDPKHLPKAALLITVKVTSYDPSLFYVCVATFLDPVVPSPKSQVTDSEFGDKLVSSGMGSVYPKNYPVGEVETINRDPGLNFLTVKVKPFANLDSTRLVLLVKPSSRERIGLNKTESAGASF